MLAVSLTFLQVQSLVAFRQSLQEAQIKSLEKDVGRFGTDKSGYGGAAIEPEKFPPGYTSAPLRWNCLGLTFNTQMNGGFFACAQNPKTFALEPAIGWCITEGKLTLVKGTTDFIDSEESEEELEEELDGEELS